MMAKPKTRSETEANARDNAEVEAARADVDVGRTVSYQQVRKWLLSWGAKKELPRPRWK